MRDEARQFIKELALHLSDNLDPALNALTVLDLDLETPTGITAMRLDPCVDTPSAAIDIDAPGRP